MSKNKESFACDSVHACELSRRSVLRVGGLGMLGLTIPRLLKAEGPAAAPQKNPALKIKPRAKSVIFLYQFGGPSHIDMFDMKPDAPEGIRGPHKPISSKADGIQVSQHLPKTAKVMDKVTDRKSTRLNSSHLVISYAVF